jgi:glycerol kinase
LWERDSGRPIGNAIVWQSRITADICDQLRAAGLAETFRAKTGLVLDAYFSGTKIKYLLDRTPGLRRRAERGEILFGTVDSFLIWRLSGGKRHVTDYSNASRTLIYNIHTLDWDDELLELLDFGGRPDQPQAVAEPLHHRACHKDRTFETIDNLAVDPPADRREQLVPRGNRPLARVHQQKAAGAVSILRTPRNETCLPERGGLLVPGIPRNRNRLAEPFGVGRCINVARRQDFGEHGPRDVEQLAATVSDAGGVSVVPAFVGLGAPYWDPYARGAILGITRGTTAGHIARAAVESMAFQTRDLVEAMQKDAEIDAPVLKVDGGASVNNALMQFQADILDTTVHRPVVAETTALGAAYLAGLAVGYWHDTADVAHHWVLDREFVPGMDAATREARYRGWQRAVERSLDWAEH